MPLPAVVFLACSLAAIPAGTGPSRAGGPCSADTTDTLLAYRRGLALVEQALDALGGLDALQRAGGLTLEGAGTADLGARLQGLRPDRAHPVPASELLAINLASGRVAYETHARVNADADEWNRYVYDGDRMLVVLRLSEAAFWVDADADHAGRYRRAVPHLLLREALTRRRSLRHLGRVDGTDAVHVTLSGGTPLTLLFDPDDHLLVGVEYLAELPVRGDAVVRWRFAGYRPIEGLGPYPSGYRIEVDGRPVKEVRYTTIEAGAAEALFGTPDGIEMPERPPTSPGGAAVAQPEAAGAPPRPPVRTLADGVYLATNVRGGFHHLFVEFGSFVLVVDAPAGYHELQMVPAVDWADAEDASAVGRRLLETVRATVPGKPVRYVVLTHHHGDHAGGLRPFIEAGATVLASAATRHVVEQAARNAFTLATEGGAPLPAPTVEVVEGERIVSDGTRSVRLLDVGANPHAEGMLVVYLPEERLLYQSDLFVPSASAFPDPARVPVMRWFVDWLDRSALDPASVYAVHGSARVTDQQLDHIRALPSDPPLPD